MGDLLTAPKQVEKQQQKQDFSLSTKMGSQWPPHSKISFEISLSCQPTLSVSRKSRSTICDHGDPPHSLKTGRLAETPSNQIFLLVQALSSGYRMRASNCEQSVKIGGKGYFDVTNAIGRCARAAIGRCARAANERFAVYAAYLQHTS